jgi:RNA polymerase sigma-70 factor, ECF subfamily
MSTGPNQRIDRVTEGTGQCRERDVGLARRMAAGDRSALGEAYAAWSHRVHTVVSRIAGCDAPDVTHDAFMQAFERAADFRGDGPLRAWIERIGVRLALRSLRRQHLLDRFTARFHVPVPAEPAPAEAAELDRAIRALPETLRAVFVLHAVEGYPHDEVALLVGISEAASRQRLRRARSLLAARLQQDYRP